MLQTSITLKVGSDLPRFINDLLQVIDTGAVIATSKIKGSNFIIQHHDSVRIQEKGILFQLFYYAWYRVQPFLKCAHHKMLVDLGRTDIDKRLYAKIIMILYPAGLGKGFKFV